ncbi:MAG: hypothetical protein ACM3KD_00970 [Hyphomicrobiaceae bacterium]
MKLFLRHAAPWACAWLLGLQAAHATETAAPAQTPPEPFLHYQGWRDEPLQDWRKANDRVREIGGWRNYLREAQQAGDGPDQEGSDHHAH